MEGYELIDSRDGYDIYRKIENGRGKWKAIKDGVAFDISYKQGIGEEPLDSSSKMKQSLGSLLGLRR